MVSGQEDRVISRSVDGGDRDGVIQGSGGGFVCEETIYTRLVGEREA
jgi:hypothetical protein